MTSLPTADRAQGLPVRKAMVVGLGNALEFYDFLTFSYFAIQIGHVFFPQSQTSNGLLWSLATFGLGFVTRPLGGVVIGMYGDRVGRKPAMMLSFSLMGFAILGLALTPSYAQIGVAAPILLLVFRLIQGFALGGEVGPSTAFLMEAAPGHRRGFYVSIQSATQGIAILSAGLIGFFLSRTLSNEALESWGWRVAFLVGAAVVPVGLYVRRNLPETLHDSHARREPAPRVRIPILFIVLSLLLLGANTTWTYVMNYMNTYAQDALKLPPYLAFGATIALGIALTAGGFLGGRLTDRFGFRRVMLTAAVIMLALALPGFILLNQLRTPAMLYALTGTLAFVGQAICVACIVAVASSLPRAARSGGIAMLYAGAVALFGGAAQFVVKWLTDVTGSPLAPAWYLSAALLIGLCAMVAFRAPTAQST